MLVLVLVLILGYFVGILIAHFVITLCEKRPGYYTADEPEWIFPRIFWPITLSWFLIIQPFFKDILANKATAIVFKKIEDFALILRAHGFVL